MNGTCKLSPNVLNSAGSPERIVEGVHLPSVQRNVFLGVVRGGGAGCEALRNRLLDVRRVVFA